MGLALRLADFFAAQDLEISLANGGFWEATCWAKIFVDCTTLGCCSAAPGLCVRILGVPFVSLLTLGCASLFLHAHPCLPSFSSPTCKQNLALLQLPPQMWYRSAVPFLRPQLKWFFKFSNKHVCENTQRYPAPPSVVGLEGAAISGTNSWNMNTCTHASLNSNHVCECANFDGRVQYSRRTRTHVSFEH